LARIERNDACVIYDHVESVGSAVVVAGCFEAVRDIVTNVSLSQSMRPVAPALRHLATGGGIGSNEWGAAPGAVFGRIEAVRA
jgi:hypothetical protein